MGSTSEMVAEIWRRGSIMDTRWLVEKKYGESIADGSQGRWVEPEEGFWRYGKIDRGYSHLML